MSDNFLSRWSRRKLEARSGQRVEEKSEIGGAAALLPAQVSGEPSNSNQAPLTSVRAERADVDPASEVRYEPQPLPTDADLAAVEQGGDIKAFLADRVSADLKNKAFKALFSRPEFNVMDGLDIYIDDYNKFTPLSAADVEKMTFSRQLLSRPDLELPQVSVEDAALDAVAASSDTTPGIAEHVLDNPSENPENSPFVGVGEKDLRVNPDSIQVADSIEESVEHSLEKPGEK